MDRRTFLKHSTLMVPAVMLPNIPGLFSRTAVANDKAQFFTLSLLTDKPDKAADALETVLKKSWAKNLDLIYSETVLPGAQMADIVFLKNNHLIDYRKAQDDFSRQLLQLRHEMRLPKKVSDPVLLQFATQTGNRQARTVALYHRDMRIAELPLTQDTEQEIRGTHGKLIVGIEGRAASVKHADCKHKTCMKMGKLTRSGQNIVCIPNEIRIAIAGENETGIDSLSF